MQSAQSCTMKGDCQVFSTTAEVSACMTSSTIHSHHHECVAVTNHSSNYCWSKYWSIVYIRPYLFTSSYIWYQPIMPLLTLHLCRLNIFTSTAVFLQELQADPSVEVVVASRPRNVIIKPTGLDADALSKRYDVLLLLRTPNAAIPSNLRSHVW